MEEASFRWTRLRWRMRGALLWPAFAVLTVFDALLLGRLPIAGDGGTGLVPALLLAALFNLLAVAVLAPLVGLRLRRRRADLPKVVADDYAGSVLLVVVTVVLLGLGLLHRPSVVDAQEDLAQQRARAEAFFARAAPPEFRAGAAASSSLKLEEDLYRTCAPGPDPKRWFCLFVRTDPLSVTVDRNRESNASLNAPGGF